MLKEILEQVLQFVSGQSSRDDLEDWVLRRTWSLKEEDDPETYRLAGQILLAMAEYTRGHLDDQELRERIKGLPAELDLRTRDPLAGR